ncbi:DUF4382 domain-containing protein [Halorubrum sp. SD690R]|uniref:DUF4382 domain-containing protein n=1 Tax=Halorubrum sp. SD690R TaxID=2518117 RepID=UPI0010F9848E|nr:DUF4382 domain-containing protein [Halorubrum sp. SD690R]TKX48226.1 DUF4382 domain-containing protein [Halorubrum sp. SD690R]
MTDRSRTADDDGSQPTDDDRPADAATGGLGRREFVAVGAGASATLLAGCTGGESPPSSGGSDGSDGSDGSEPLTGTFRLLISDAPADIDDFDRLDVTLDRARVFEAGDGEDEDDEDGDENEDDAGENVTDTDGDDGSPNGTADDEDEGDDVAGDESGDDEEDTEGDDDEEDDADEGEDRGFRVVDLDGATVDLTQVIDEDAIAVFDGELPAGDYEKIELAVSAIEGTVDGGEVDVKLPSEKLQITNGFEVTADEPVSFVFDINVVKRGKNNGYILKPVISGSGVAGRDVEVNEIDEDEDGDGDIEESEADEDGEEGGGEESDDGETTDDSGDGDATGGNETDDAENGTETGS